MATVNRRYESPLRRSQAQSTRRTLLEAAGRLFAERGFAATSIEDIAEAAGVGRATVFTSVGDKFALLKGAYDMAVMGDEQPIPLVQRPRSQQILAEPTAERFVAAYAQLATEICGRVAGIYEAVSGAAGADPRARAMWEAIRAERRRGSATVVKAVIAKGGLRRGLDPQAAADVVWTLNDPRLYDQLVNQRGWSVANYTAWLGETMQAQLLKLRTRP